MIATECSERFQQLRERREMAAEPVPASYEFLAAQRRNIYARMGEKPQARMKWVPALAAAACLLAAGVFVHRPAAQVAKPEIVDRAIVRRCILDGAIDGAAGGEAD